MQRAEDLAGPNWWRRVEGGIEVVVRVTPNARRSELIAVEPELLRLKLAAPAVEGRANAELVRAVAALLGVRPGAVELLRGNRSRTKTVHVRGLDAPPPLPRPA